ncbi:hypothetical protein LTR28_011552, partial [Elasticomyces elasticus]
ASRPAVSQNPPTRLPRKSVQRQSRKSPPLVPSLASATVQRLIPMSMFQETYSIAGMQVSICMMEKWEWEWEWAWEWMASGMLISC